MDREKIVRYIQDQLQNGYALENIKRALRQQGISSEDIFAAQAMVQKRRLEQVQRYVSQHRGSNRKILHEQLLQLGYTPKEIDAAIPPIHRLRLHVPNPLLIFLILALLIGGAILALKTYSNDAVPSASSREPLPVSDAWPKEPFMIPRQTSVPINELSGG